MRLSSKKYILISLLLVIFLSCDRNKFLEHKTEYLMFSAYLEEAQEIKAGKVYQYLDSIQNNNTNTVIKKYCDVSKLHFLDKKYTNEKYTEYKEKINQFKNESLFPKQDPYYNYLIFVAIHHLHVYRDIDTYSKNELIVNNLMEAIKHLNPYKETFEPELMWLYSTVSYFLFKEFNEFEKADEFADMAIEMAYKQNKTDLVIQKLANKVNAYVRSKKYEEAKLIINKSLALAKETNNEGLNDIFKFHFFKYYCFEYLNQKDSLHFVTEEVERLHDKKLINDYNYWTYSSYILHNDIRMNRTDGIPQKYDKLSKYLDSLPSKHLENLPRFEYVLDGAMMSYYNKMNQRIRQNQETKTVKKRDGDFKKAEEWNKNIKNLDKWIYHSKKALENIEVVKRDNETLCFLGDELTGLSSVLSKKNYIQEANFFRKQIIKIDSLRYLILQKESDAFKKSLDFIANQKIETANQKMLFEKQTRYAYMLLFGMTAIFLLASIYLLYLLFSRNQKINAQKKEIELITNSLSIGLCKIDTDLNIVWANNSLKKTYNFTEEQLNSGTSYSTILHPSYFELVNTKLKSIKDDEYVVLEGAMTKDFKPKQVFEAGMLWLKTTFIPSRGDDGVIKHYIISSDNHTEEKSIEYRLEQQKTKIELMNTELKTQSQTIAKQNLELEQMNNKLSTSNENLSQFAAIAAHDLKAPLRTITSFSQILVKKYKNEIAPSDKELFNFIINDANSLKEMIDGLLDYSKISNQDLEFTSTNLEVIILQCVSKLNSSIQEKQANIILPTSFPTIKGHSTLLGQVFLNLMSNSLKFVPKDALPVIKIAWKEYQTNTILISIEDNGIGIEKKHQSDIFNIFRKLHSKNKYQGNGIGLSTCKKIIESHGGKIWLESELGQGTTFFFTLQI